MGAYSRVGVSGLMFTVTDIRGGTSGSVTWKRSSEKAQLTTTWKEQGSTYPQFSTLARNYNVHSTQAVDEKSNSFTVLHYLARIKREGHFRSFPSGDDTRLGSDLEEGIWLVQTVYRDVADILVCDYEGGFVVGHPRLVEEAGSKVVVLEWEVQVRKDSCSDQTYRERPSVLYLHGYNRSL